MNDSLMPFLLRRSMFLSAVAILASTAACSSDKEAAADGDSATAAEAKDEHGDEKEGPKRDTVTLTEVGAQTARIVVEAARSEGGGADAGGLEVAGTVEFDPARLAIVSPRTPGRIERLLVVPGDRVEAGQTVALLYSPAFITAQTDLLQATRRATTLRGTPDAEGADALVAAAKRRLELLGVGSRAIADLEAGEPLANTLPVVAPFGGTIIESPALAGQAVDAGAALFKIADLSVVNVAAQVPERNLSSIRIGQGASIRVPSFPNLRFAGRVDRTGDQVDPEKRTVEALVRVTNTNRALKPGMFATVVLHVPLAVTTVRSEQTAATLVSVPEEAVVTDGTARYVFVQVAPLTFVRREIRLASGAGATAGGRVVITEGIIPGDPIVTRGAFTLKSQLAKASFGEDHH